MIPAPADHIAKCPACFQGCRKGHDCACQIHLFASSPPKPTPIPYTFEKIPAYFRQRPQWVCWKYEFRDNDWTKPPYMAKQVGRKASSTDKATWASFEDAVAAYETPVAQYDGIGYCIDVETEQLVGTDLDHYLDDQFQPNGFTETAKAIVATLNSYTELSVGGKGLHIYAFGTLPPDGRRKGHVEMYASGRYFTFTGVSVPGMPSTLSHRPREIAAVHAQYIAKPETPAAALGTPAMPAATDVEILSLVIKNHPKAEVLIAGDLSGYDDDQSRADLALLSLLATYTQDPEQLDRLMRSSALGQREKWTKRADYRARTIAKALIRRSLDEGADEKERFTDVKNAERLSMSARQAIRYCEARGYWYVYDGARWAQGSGNLVKPFVHQLARDFHELASAEPDPELRKQYRHQANRLETDHVIRAVINQAMALRELQIDPTRFDQHVDLLNVLNGTIDLRTGTLQPHNPDDLLSYIAPVEYHSNAVSELWETTIRLAMKSDAEMISYLQRVYGYALTGHTTEKRFFEEYGPTNTGKTTINHGFQKMLGPDYAKSLRPEALMAQREPDKIPHEIADLMGVRFVVVSEAPDDHRMNEELLKKLTGGDGIRACFKYGKTFEYDAQLTLVIYSNDRIGLGGSDDAVWERATSIPFTFNFKTETEIPGYVHIKDVRVTLEQADHQQGILAWAVRGAVLWYQQGLEPTPQKVTLDTEAHRQEVNSVRCFLRERCEEGVGSKIAFQTFHRAYSEWARQERQEKLKATQLTEQMAKLGHTIQTVCINRNNVNGYVGIQLQRDQLLSSEEA